MLKLAITVLGHVNALLSGSVVAACSHQDMMTEWSRQSNRLTSAGLTGNLVVQSTEEARNESECNEELHASQGIRQLQLYKGRAC